MAEKEGFEPSIPFWGIHDFQSCALGQLRDFSIVTTAYGQLAYITLFVMVCQDLNPKKLNHYAPNLRLTLNKKADIMAELKTSMLLWLSR